MHDEELSTMGIQGSYRDVLYDEAGRVTWDRGWRKNTIVLDGRRLLAALMKGDPDAAGIQGIWFGMGNPLWDGGVPPPGLPTDTALVDAHPYFLPVGSLQVKYLNPVTGNETDSPNKALQIIATLGLNQPSWPDGNHVDGTLREFGLVGKLNGQFVLVNLVRHVAIPKDPASTLVRTIQLVF